VQVLVLVTCSNYRPRLFMLVQFGQACPDVTGPVKTPPPPVVLQPETDVRQRPEMHH